MAEARQRDEWARTSSLMTLIANVHRNHKKTRAFKPSDFDPLAPRRQATPVVGVEILKEVFLKEREQTS